MTCFIFGSSSGSAPSDWLRGRQALVLALIVTLVLAVSFGVANGGYGQSRSISSPTDPHTRGAGARTDAVRSHSSRENADRTTDRLCELSSEADTPTPGSLAAVEGDPEGAVTVLTLLDPNCPHCKTMHGILATVRQRFPGVRFEYLPFPLWGRSLPKVEALYAAQRQGGFTPLLSALFQHQNTPLSTDALARIAASVGLDGDELEQDLRTRRYRRPALVARRRVVQSGYFSVPHVFIQGRHVDQGSRSAACLSVLVQSALARHRMERQLLIPKRFSAPGFPASRDTVDTASSESS